MDRSPTALACCVFVCVLSSRRCMASATNSVHLCSVDFVRRLCSVCDTFMASDGYGVIIP